MLMPLPAHAMYSVLFLLPSVNEPQARYFTKMHTKISMNIPKNISAALRKALVSIFLSIVLFLTCGVSEHYSLHKLVSHDVLFGENADVYAL